MGVPWVIEGESLQKFKKYGGELDTRRNAPTDHPALIDAADSGDGEVVIALLEAGASPITWSAK